MENTEKFHNSRSLIKSKKRVTDHGEVFTPNWLVEAMLDLTKESERIEARFLEPSCGNGNFLIQVLRRKLANVEMKSKKSPSEKKYFSLIALMSIYGIEILRDNIVECRERLLSFFADYLKIDLSDEFYRAAHIVLSLNLVHGDALEMTTDEGHPIVFAEWEYLGKGKFGRRDFRFDMLVQESGDKREAVAPIKIYGPANVREIARSKSNKFRELREAS